MKILLKYSPRKSPMSWIWGVGTIGRPKESRPSGVEKSHVTKLGSGKQNDTDRTSKWCAGAGAQWNYHSKLPTQDIVF